MVWFSISWSKIGSVLNLFRRLDLKPERSCFKFFLLPLDDLDFFVVVFEEIFADVTVYILPR